MEYQPPASCLDCTRLMCKITIPRFHFKYQGLSSTSIVDGHPAQDKLLWEFFEFALKNCFQIQEFRVMLFYGLYEHNLQYFLQETDELEYETVINFLRRTNQLVKKLHTEFGDFSEQYARHTTISDLIPNMITIIQMQMLKLCHSYFERHKHKDDMPFSIEDVLNDQQVDDYENIRDDWD